MNKRVLIIGGYGNFGSFISKALALDSNLQIIIAGRSLTKATKMALSLSSLNPIETAELDINHEPSKAFDIIKPDIVIHTSGPFQHQDYHIAKICIERGCHYIDLADGRQFVNNITSLHKAAQQKQALVITGASSVPCLTSALIDHYQTEFSDIDSLDYGITTAQKSARGLATTAAILGYTGKKITTLINGQQKDIYGWQSLHTRHYKKLGKRLLGNCDIPDLALFPERYPTLKNIRFYAGLEVPFVHISLWGLSWLVRITGFKHLPWIAPWLLKASYWFDWLGTDKSALHMQLSGKDKQGVKKTRLFELTAYSGDGPYIPCMPAIMLAKKIANDDIKVHGAYPCMGFLTLNEYLDSLEDLDISWHTY